MNAYRRSFLRRGMRVGIFGGSFDPPHQGHLHVSKEALKRFGLDRILWLVSPGNPLKDKAPAALERRMHAANFLLRGHPSILVSDFEAQVGTRYTAKTLAALQNHYKGVQFVWLMGADNLAQIHKWQYWHRIFETVPVGVMARPGLRIAARTSHAAKFYRRARLAPKAATLLPCSAPPAWCFVNIPMRDVSSTELRLRGQWS